MTVQCRLFIYRCVQQECWAQFGHNGQPSQAQSLKISPNIYIYIYRDRERERERAYARTRARTHMHMHTRMSFSLYICILYVHLFTCLQIVAFVHFFYCGLASKSLILRDAGENFRILGPKKVLFTKHMKSKINYKTFRHR